MSNVYEQITKQSKTLMLKEPFYGLFLISLNKELTESIPTACVTPNGIGIKLCVNPKFWETLDENTKLAVLKHELLHIAFFHLNNWDRFPNKKLYNISADLEINQYIQKEYKGEKWNGLEYNEGSFKELNLEPLKGTKYYYEKLQEEIDNNPDGDIAQMADENGDLHPLWKAMEGMGEAERKLIQKQIENSLKELAESNKSRGNVPKELKELIDSLFENKAPVISWKEYLRRFNSQSAKVISKKTRYKENTRFNGNPALKRKPTKTTLVAIDTSGSVNNKELAEFFNEINHIFKSGTEVTIIECDTIIQRVYEFKGLKEDTSVKGRGGTSFDPVFEYINENRNKFSNLIYLTDGEASAPSSKIFIPTLWVHSSVSEINEDLPGLKIKINNI